MRGPLLLLSMVLLAACHKEPDFEERYDKAAKEIEARAQAMDADIARSDKAAATSDGLPPEANRSTAPLSSGE